MNKAKRLKEKQKRFKLFILKKINPMNFFLLGDVVGIPKELISNDFSDEKLNNFIQKTCVPIKTISNHVFYVINPEKFENSIFHEIGLCETLTDPRRLIFIRKKGVIVQT